MRTWQWIMLGVAVVSAARWQVDAGLGIGRHLGTHDEQVAEYPTHWDGLLAVRSDLYQGLQGQLCYSLTRGQEEGKSIADDQVALSFMSGIRRGRLKFDVGLGLGIHHRELLLDAIVMNQAYVPFFFKVSGLEGRFSGWGFSSNLDQAIQTPLRNNAWVWNRVLQRWTVGVHYQPQALEYALLYQSARFSDSQGFHGINTARLDMVLIYHFDA